MSATEDFNYNEIVTIVRTWTHSQRVALVRDVLATLDMSEEQQAKRSTLAQARGLLSSSDTSINKDIQQLLNERRRERYNL